MAKNGQKVTKNVKKIIKIVLCFLTIFNQKKAKKKNGSFRLHFGGQIKNGADKKWPKMAKKSPKMSKKGQNSLGYFDHI